MADATVWNVPRETKSDTEQTRCPLLPNLQSPSKDGSRLVHDHHLGKPWPIKLYPLTSNLRQKNYSSSLKGRCWGNLSELVWLS